MPEPARWRARSSSTEQRPKRDERVSDTDLRPASPAPGEPPSNQPTVDERDGYTMNSYRDFAATGFGGDTDAKGPSRFLGPLALVGALFLLGFFGGITMVIIVLALILSIVL